MSRQKGVSTIITTIKINFIWTTIHWWSMKAYNKYCIPDTLLGYMLTPIMTQTPHCKILLSAHKYSLEAFDSISKLFISWLLVIVHSFAVKE